MTARSLYSFTRLALLGAVVLTSWASSPAQAVGRFGTGCQKTFQNGWQDKLTYAFTRCARFNNELDDTDSKIFYYNLENAEWWWEGAGDQDTLDNVHLFYGNTHGGTTSNRSIWAMWDEDMDADSTDMRLGNESYGTSIFSTYSCETLKYGDDKLWTRMGPIFRGGLRYATGSHDKVYDSITTDEVGEDYADNLQKQKTIKYAWKDANSDWAASQDLTVVATGTNPSNCHSRRDNMKWQNITTYARLRDGQIGWVCRASWNNL